ncbi:SRPBCC family protein [Nakamurella lactea]|uniref:hypothetical protein n=1 Tax=Nakamurella lactea TaxID=459515 RepID=UPI00040C1F01|nr:hypothetical protein [Nakamurella lactea]
MNTQNGLQSLPDSIERTVTINAPVDQVWRLVSCPGWWINDGEIRDHEITVDGSVATVRDPELGVFPIEIVESREPEYASYRWLAGSNDEQDGAAHTLVEFFVTGDDGAVQVRVLESGWAAAPADDRVRSAYDENTEGWELELSAARVLLERDPRRA